jgi:hypothetical protein
MDSVELSNFPSMAPASGVPDDVLFLVVLLMFTPLITVQSLVRHWLISGADHLFGLHIQGQVARLP